MCLVGLSLLPTPEIACVIASNRDELHARPARELHEWPDQDVIAGKDELAGGTWMGVSKRGRYAAITNFRHPSARRSGASRGQLPLRYLTGDLSPMAFAQAEAESAFAYGSFNLIVGDLTSAAYLADGVERGAPIVTALEPGVVGLSNGRLGDEWPKVRRIALALRGHARAEALFDALGTRETAPPAELPATGVSAELELFLSAPFLVSPEYGTRASTVLVLYRDGSFEIEERSFGPDGGATGTRRVTR